MSYLQPRTTRRVSVFLAPIRFIVRQSSQRWLDFLALATCRVPWENQCFECFPLPVGRELRLVTANVGRFTRERHRGRSAVGRCSMNSALGWNWDPKRWMCEQLQLFFFAALVSQMPCCFLCFLSSQDLYIRYFDNIIVIMYLPWMWWAHVIHATGMPDKPENLPIVWWWVGKAKKLQTLTFSCRPVASSLKAVLKLIRNELPIWIGLCHNWTCFAFQLLESNQPAFTGIHMFPLLCPTCIHLRNHRWRMKLGLQHIDRSHYCTALSFQGLSSISSAAIWKSIDRCFPNADGGSWQTIADTKNRRLTSYLPSRIWRVYKV